MTSEALAALNEVLLQAALRAERINVDAAADIHAAQIARRGDKLAK